MRTTARGEQRAGSRRRSRAARASRRRAQTARDWPAAAARAGLLEQERAADFARVGPEAAPPRRAGGGRAGGVGRGRGAGRAPIAAAPPPPARRGLRSAPDASRRRDAGQRLPDFGRVEPRQARRRKRRRRSALARSGCGRRDARTSPPAPAPRRRTCPARGAGIGDQPAVGADDARAHRVRRELRERVGGRAEASQQRRDSTNSALGARIVDARADAIGRCAPGMRNSTR